METKTYNRNVSPVEMLDGRRRPWRKIAPDLFEVISRDGKRRYRIQLAGGMPLCNCPAAQHARPCWHASLVLKRLEREQAARPKPATHTVPDDPFEGIVGEAPVKAARRVSFSDEVPF